MRFACSLPLLFLVTAVAAQGRHPQRVLFVGDLASARGKAFAAFLGAKFADVRVAKRFTDLPDLAAVDVVVLDWSQTQDEKGRSPIGARDAWRKPLVLIGSAGHDLAGVWSVRGGFG